MNVPIVGAFLSLLEDDDQWPHSEQMYVTAHTPPSPETCQDSTIFSNRPTQPTQYYSDSLAIAFEPDLVSPYEQSSSPRSHTNASYLSVPPPSPGSFIDFFAEDNPQRWLNVAGTESEIFSEVLSSAKTFLASTTILANRTSNITAALKPNCCHLCGMSFTQPQVLRRHLKDKHEDKESCTHCLSFKWSRGRPHLYRRHLKLKHPQFASSEDRPGRAQKQRAVGAYRRKTLNGRTQATSGGDFPNLCHVVVFRQDFRIIYSICWLAKCSSSTYCRTLLWGELRNRTRKTLEG